MAILAECPICHRKQATRNKLCSCGEDLVKAKRSKRVKYWISYRLPDGSQKRESVYAIEDLNGYSIEDAHKAHSKRVTARRLGLKPQTLYNGIGRKAKKRFPLRPKRLGGKPLFDNRDIEAFIESLPYEKE